MGTERVVKDPTSVAHIRPHRNPASQVTMALGLGVGVLFVVSAVTSFVLWGPRYGFIVATLLLWSIALPTWVVARFLDLPPRLEPTHRRLVRTLVVASLLIAAAGILAFQDLQSASFAERVTLGISGAVLFALPVLFILLSLDRAGRLGSPLLLEPTVAKGIVLGIVGSVLGIASLSLLAFPYFAWSDPYLMTNGRDGFTRLAGAYTWITWPTVALAAAYPAAWAFGLVQSGFLSASYAAARARRRESSERLRGRLDDHYALHRVQPDTHRALRDRLTLERDGQVPGEAAYVSARAAVVRLLVLGILMVVTVGLALAGAGQSVEWNAAAEREEVPGAPYWPCTDCQDPADLDAFLAQVQDWRLWTYLLLATIGVFGVYCLVSVSNLFAIMRRARAEVDAFWAERDRLEEAMLEEVRAATAPPR